MAKGALRLSIPSDPAYLELVGQYVTFCAHRVGFAARDAARIRLAVDEACANVLAHAQPDDPDGSFVVICEPTAVELTVRVQDHGPPFELEAVPEPDVAAPLEKRQIGGLGVYFMRQIMDTVEVRAIPGGKELVLTKRLERREGGDGG